MTKLEEYPGYCGSGLGGGSLPDNIRVRPV